MNIYVLKGTVMAVSFADFVDNKGNGERIVINIFYDFVIDMDIRLQLWYDNEVKYLALIMK